MKLGLGFFIGWIKRVLTNFADENALAAMLKNAGSQPAYVKASDGAVVFPPTAPVKDNADYRAAAQYVNLSVEAPAAPGGGAAQPVNASLFQQQAQIVKGLGADLAAQTTATPEKLTALQTTAANYGMKLRGVWQGAELDQAAAQLEMLADYTVMLRSEKQGWAPGEIALIGQAVLALGDALLRHYRERYGNPLRIDAAFAFRSLCGPLCIRRVPGGNINPDVTPVFWAINPDGYSVRLGDKAFTGRGALRTIGRIARYKFEPIHLVIHEMAHCINWRYKVMNGQGLAVAPDKFYQSTGQVVLPAAYSPTGQDETVHLDRFSDGFLYNPRSSNDPWETVTDLITNDVVQSFTINQPGAEPMFGAAQDLQGRVRQYQAVTLMRAVIEARLRDFRPLGDAALAGLPVLALRNARWPADQASAQALGN